MLLLSFIFYQRIQRPVNGFEGKFICVFRGRRHMEGTFAEIPSPFPIDYHFAEQIIPFVYNCPKMFEL